MKYRGFISPSWLHHHGLVRAHSYSSESGHTQIPRMEPGIWQTGRLDSSSGSSAAEPLHRLPFRTEYCNPSPIFFSISFSVIGISIPLESVYNPGIAFSSAFLTSFYIYLMAAASAADPQSGIPVFSPWPLDLLVLLPGGLHEP